ncbi:unnamed protein product [Pleuronectes platessa]|uniref:Uncharacterized protein n=1 Tax=Pleuronectes platessa TaxID=8262 RepID=A0A9N7VP02_PLEPL|nr:unnamed protein product [Pleuronectes platessa]
MFYSAHRLEAHCPAPNCLLQSTACEGWYSSRVRASLQCGSASEQMVPGIMVFDAFVETFKWPHKQGTPGSPLIIDSAVWKDAAAAPAQAPTAPTAPTAGLRWGAGALAARLTGALQTMQPPKVLFPPERQDTAIEITPAINEPRSRKLTWCKGLPGVQQEAPAAVFGL